MKGRLKTKSERPTRLVYNSGHYVELLFIMNRENEMGIGVMKD